LKGDDDDDDDDDDQLHDIENNNYKLYWDSALITDHRNR
jgi:hypothetical protein